MTTANTPPPAQLGLHGLTAITAWGVTAARAAAQRVTAARDTGALPDPQDEALLNGWLAMLTDLAQQACDHRHPELKGLGARLDHLTGDVRARLARD